ncbi:hypothetical protein [Janthinobacterium sp. P210006]|uniref:hypothetical protein n=1 Tax=Janthinobacterium sp. P210006 TaxID=3112939 RepID=UPI002E25D304|nr:hypothetical protein [Janthinobacterium sp. P210006]
MLLKNNEESFEFLFNAIGDYYEKNGNREVYRFENVRPVGVEGEDYYVRYLLERKHVVEYRIAQDRGGFIAIPSLAIGPHYFNPGEFWDYKNSRRFTLEASIEGIEHNLKLLDEFFGRG